MEQQTELTLKLNEGRLNSTGLLEDQKTTVTALQNSGMNTLLQYAYCRHFEKVAKGLASQIMTDERAQEIADSDPKVKKFLDAGEPVIIGGKVFSFSHQKRYGYTNNNIPEEHRALEKHYANLLQEANETLEMLQPMRTRARKNGTANLLASRPVWRYLGNQTDLLAKSGKVVYEPNAGFDNNFDGVTPNDGEA